MPTYQQRLEAGLKKIGANKFQKNSNTVPGWQCKDIKHLLFVGSRGALRAGPSWSKSWSIGDPINQTPFYRYLLTHGDMELGHNQEPKDYSNVSEL